MPDTRLILHIKGTDNQTAELPKNVVRAGIAQGQISRSQLIWSKAHNAWKQVRELPHLWPSQKLAPAPAPRVGTVPLPNPAAVGPAPTGSVPKVVVKASAGNAPGQSARVAVTPAVRAGRADHVVVEHEGSYRFMKWICSVLSALIFVAVCVNYFMVDQPITSGLSQTAYAKVPVYAHLGGFVQPGALVIHIVPSTALTSANLADFLQVLAHSTPRSPAGGDIFDDVSLTTGWTGHYSFTGYAWKELGDMADKDDDYKQAFLLDQLKDVSGQALVSPNGALDSSAQQAERDRAWADFVTYFTR